MTNEPAELPKGTLTVGGVHNEIAAALRDRFNGEIWVVGEVSGKKQSANGHVYLDLVERRAPGGPVVATLKVSALRNDLGPIRAALQRVKGVQINDGVEVRIRGRLTTYAPQGSMQLQMTGIDPEWTLGRLAANKDELLRALAREGVLQRNKQRDVSPLPLRVALVTSHGSAAYHDFTKELELSGYSWQVLVHDTRVQGENAPELIAATLRAVGRRKGSSWEPDVVALIRGGGSRTDLQAFDAEAVARAIADLPYPVLTGIGHEIDRSVADEAAHTMFKTPTACAQALVTRVGETHRRSEQLHERIASTAQRQLGTAEAALQGASRAVGRISEARLQRAEERLQAGLMRISRAAEHRLAREEDRVEGAERRTQLSAPRQLVRAEERLEAAAALVAASDPDKLLRRGFSVTRTSEGALVRSAGDVEDESVLVTQLHEGSIVSKVHKDKGVPPVRKKPAGRAKEEKDE